MKSTQVRTASGASVRARHVVVCAGGYIGRLAPALSDAVLPIATYVMATAPLGEERARAVMRTRAAVYDTRFAFDYYRMLADTRLLWGGRISILERTPAQVARLLHADMLRVYPQLADVRVDYAWSGLMSYSRHKMVQLGRLPNGVWHAMGFGGHGVGPTTLAGELVAEAVVRGPQVLGAFAQFGTDRTYGWMGQAAAQSTYWYLQARDWLKE
jgi:glycine/D-amino acid oxidase-like deaminating enzyme